MNKQITEFLRDAAMLRKTGQTIWLLDAALTKSDCILVFANHSCKSYAQRLFYKMRQQAWKDLPFYKKWLFDKDAWFQQRQPLFMTLTDSLHGHKKPVFFDSSCFPLMCESI